jgi:hypothetical protein
LLSVSRAAVIFCTIFTGMSVKSGNAWCRPQQPC